MIERYKAEDLLKCVKCKNLYIENENRMDIFMSQTCLNKIHCFISDSCVHHDGFVFVNEGPELEIYTPSQVATIFRELERKSITYPNRPQEFEGQTKKYKWICCDKTFTNVRGRGCKRGKHGFFPNGNDSTSQQLANGGINRLNQAMIDEWEEACRNNEEYNEKWLILTKEY